jgi:amidase/nitrilase
MLEIGDRLRHVRESDGSTNCDIDAALREYAFETQTFVVSCGMYAPPDSVPSDFPYKPVGNWRWAVGGSCVVNPFGVYLVEPISNRKNRNN